MPAVGRYQHSISFSSQLEQSGCRGKGSSFFEQYLQKPNTNTSYIQKQYFPIKNYDLFARHSALSKGGDGVECGGFCMCMHIYIKEEGKNIQGGTGASGAPGM